MAQTTKSLRSQVLRQVKENGGFSVFWATERLDRAKVICELEKAGIISRKPGEEFGEFPWCGYVLRSEQ